jgi:hypothetical protein
MMSDALVNAMLKHAPRPRKPVVVPWLPPAPHTDALPLAALAYSDLTFSYEVAEDKTLVKPAVRSDSLDYWVDRGNDAVAHVPEYYFKHVMLPFPLPLALALARDGEGETLVKPAARSDAMDEYIDVGHDTVAKVPDPMDQVAR